MRMYGRLLVSRGVPRLVVAAALSRLTTSMLSLAILLAVIDLHGSYAGAGGVLTGHAMGLALFAPVTGRLADRFGARAVLLGCLAGQAVAYAGLLTALGQQAGVPVVIVAGVAVGVSNPPASSVTRALWPKLCDGDLLRSAYALDSVVNSSMFIAGPLVAGGLVLLISPFAAVAAAGLVKVTGDLLLATAPILGRTRRAASDSPGLRRLGPLTDARIRLLLVVVSLDTFMHGCLQVGAAARTGGESSAGLLVSALAAGEVVGGLVYGMRRWPGDPRRQLIVLHMAAAIVLFTAGPVTALAVICGLYLAAGLVSGGRDALNQIVIADYTPAVYRTEAFAWLTTFMWMGYGVGTSVAGQVEEHIGTSAIYPTGATAGLIAAIVVTFVRYPSQGHGSVRP
jgi:MFS family permease